MKKSLSLINNIINEIEKKEIKGNTILMDRNTYSEFTRELLGHLSNVYSICTKIEERDLIDKTKEDIHKMTYRDYKIEPVDGYLFMISIINKN